VTLVRVRIPSRVVVLSVVVAWAPARAWAQTDGTALPAALDLQVRALVAARWHVDAADVALRPVPLADTLPTADAAEVALLGSGSGGHWVVKARWDDGAGTALRVLAGVRTSVTVAARELARGESVVEADMRAQDTVRWDAPAARQAPVEAGWVTQRLIREGETLRWPAVQPPLAVVSGRPVALVWRSGGIELRVQGTASGSAPMGGEVLVRTQEGRRLRGVVVGKGVVDVTSGAPTTGTQGGTEG
jgi:flagella basal body P-ring formation protein FlgA